MRRAVPLGLILVALAGQAQGQTSPASTEGGRPMSSAEIRELLDASKATAKATRENVDYVRVVPDMMEKILAKLDKIEDKLDKVENAIKRDQAARARSR